MRRADRFNCARRGSRRRRCRRPRVTVPPGQAGKDLAVLDLQVTRVGQAAGPEVEVAVVGEEAGRALPAGHAQPHERERPLRARGRVQGDGLARPGDGLVDADVGAIRIRKGDAHVDGDVAALAEADEAEVVVRAAQIDGVGRAQHFVRIDVAVAGERAGGHPPVHDGLGVGGGRAVRRRLRARRRHGIEAGPERASPVRTGQTRPQAHGGCATRRAGDERRRGHQRSHR